MNESTDSNDTFSPQRQRIREAAVALFEEQGYSGTRMSDIAARLGMQAPSLYNHVSSKQELLHEVMFTNMELMLEEHRLAVASTPVVVDKLRRAMEAHVRHCARFRAEMRISTHEVPSLEEPARGKLLQLRSDYSHVWVELLDQGVAEGEFRIRHTHLAANALIQMGVGVALWIRPLPLSESELVYSLGEMALGAAGVQGADGIPAAPAAIEAVAQPASES
jgi:AcrR family transcriptional regulator